MKDYRRFLTGLVDTIIENGKGVVDVGIDDQTIRTNTFLAGKDDSKYCIECSNEISDNDYYGMERHCLDCYVNEDYVKKAKSLESQVKAFRERQKAGTLPANIKAVLSDYEWAINQANKMIYAKEKIKGMKQLHKWEVERISKSRR